MKRFFTFFVIAVVVSAISACTKTQVIDPELYISESSSGYDVASDGGNISINVSHNTDYTISIDVDWISALQTKALETDGVTFKVAENPSNQIRKGIITFTTSDGTISQTAEVVQAGLYEIYYYSYYNAVITPYKSSAFGANILSNTYEDGKGTIKFDKPVTVIGEKAFYSSNLLTGIELPNTVTSIGNQAFYNAENLRGITVPESVTEIGERAFWNCNLLKEATLPKSITTIKSKAFADCNSLEKINIPDSVTEIADHAFQYCKSLQEIILPDNLQKLGNYAFMDCDSLKKIDIPTNVKLIGQYAFSSCNNITSIGLPDGLSEIGKNAFSGCRNLQNINIPQNVKKIGKDAFNGCSSLKQITVPNSITTIEDYLFASCMELESINIPDNIEKIGDGAFFSCISLKNINIPNGTKEIGALAFFQCNSLTTLTIPENVNTINDAAFRLCMNLKEITLPENVQNIGYGVFGLCPSLSSFKGKYASADNRSLIVNDTLKAIAPQGITSYTIPEGVRIIGNGSIWTYNEPTGTGNSISHIILPESLTEIEENAFSECAPLEKIEVLSAIPPVLKIHSVFVGNTIGNCLTNDSKIYVPQGSLDAYRNAEGWRDYAHIILPME